MLRRIVVALAVVMAVGTSASANGSPEELKARRDR